MFLSVILDECVMEAMNNKAMHVYFGAMQINIYSILIEFLQEHSFRLWEVCTQCGSCNLLMTLASVLE